jgi:hypothetical protein
MRPNDAISTTELLEAWEDVVSRRESRRSRRERLAAGYVVLGLLVAVASVLILLLIRTGDNDRVSDVVIAAAGLAGVGLAALGVLVGLSAESRREMTDRPSVAGGATDDVDMDVSYFLARWVDLEIALRELVATRLGPSRADASLSRVLGSIQETELLSRADLQSLRDLLEFRNGLAHGRVDADPRGVGRARSELEDLLDRVVDARHVPR